MTTTSNIVSADQFREAFRLAPNPWSKSAPERALVQLGLPSPNSVTLWLAPERGKKLAPSVSVVDHPNVSPRFLPAGGTGPMRVELAGLSPNTAYQIAVSPGGSAPSHMLRATTAPAATTATTFSFLASSCFAPYEEPGGRLGAFIEGRRWRRRPEPSGKTAHITRRTAHILRLLERRACADAANKPSFLLGLGDQVYVDAGSSAGQAMLEGWNADVKRYAAAELADFFETVYRVTFSIQPYAAALQALPSAMIWDDHEIRDGWGSHGDEEDQTKWRQHLATARDYFVGWQASRNPPREASACATAEGFAKAAQVGASLTRSTELDFSFDWGRQASFFVMDLRSYRYAKEERVVSTEQLDRLEAWFKTRDDGPTVWVLGSTLPLGHNPGWFDRLQAWCLKVGRRDDMLDAWWSEPLRRQHDRVLEIIEKHFRAHPAHRLLVLSGDVHFSELLELSIDGRVFGHEVVSSGLAQSYFKRWRASSRKQTQLRSGMLAKGLGRFHGPAFAEVFVLAQDNVCCAPNVELTFHTSVTRDGAHLANLTNALPKRLKLPLTSLAEIYGPGGELFEHFIEVDPRHIDSTGVEPTSSEGATL